jgi:hypothetical protein
MTEQQRFVVVGPDGQDDADGQLPEHAKLVAAAQGTDPGDAIGEPAKVMRIGTMIKQLLEEVRAAPLDDASRVRLKDIHAASIKELESGLTPDLRDELERLTLPFTEDSVPSDAELRIAQAQLVGWLEGVFHGLQAALVAQQLAARSQLEQMRRGALLPGMSDAQDLAAPAAHPGSGTGQYL